MMSGKDGIYFEMCFVVLQQMASSPSSPQDRVAPSCTFALEITWLHMRRCLPHACALYHNAPSCGEKSLYTTTWRNLKILKFGSIILARVLAFVFVQCPGQVNWNLPRKEKVCPGQVHKVEPPRAFGGPGAQLMNQAPCERSEQKIFSITPL